MIQIWAPNLNSLGVPDAGGATACQFLTLTVLGGAVAQPRRCYRPALGHWAVPPPRPIQLTGWAPNLAQTSPNSGLIGPYLGYRINT